MTFDRKNDIILYVKRSAILFGHLSQNMKHIPERCVFFVFKKKWKVYLFYNGIFIKKVKIKNKEELTSFFITVIGHKKMFGKYITKILVKPKELLKTNDDKKQMFFGVVFERGVNI